MLKKQRLFRAFDNSVKLLTNGQGEVKLPYIKRTVQAGNVIYIKKYYSSRYGGVNRFKKSTSVNPTSTKMKEINERNAVEKLTWLINSNFEQGDYHLTLTYAGECPTVDEAKENLRKLNRKLRAEYKKAGKNFKYVEVTEYESTRIHHHIVLKAIDSKVLTKAWRFGSIHIRPLYSSGDFSSLAAYLVKETKRTFQNEDVKRKRWNASKNLEKPKIKKEIVDADSWTESPTALKGYYIVEDSIYSDITIEGYPFQTYKMIKISDKKGTINDKQCNYPRKVDLKSGA